MRIATLLLAALCLPAGAAEQSGAEVFDTTCIKCHGAEKQKGKLRVDTLEATLKGGENGESVVKGNSAKSPLVHSIARLDPDAAMPPDGKGDPLSKEQIGIVRAWIDQGAK